MILNEKMFKKSKKSKTSFNIEQIKIKNGKMSFKINNMILKSNNLNLTSIRNKNRIIYYLKTPSLEIELPIEKTKVKIRGRLNGKLYQENENIKISSLIWRTNNFNIKISGNVISQRGINLTALFSGNPKELLKPVLKEFNISGFISSRLSILKKKGEALFISSIFKGKSFNLGKERFNNLRGEGRWNNNNKRINIKGYIQSDKTRAFLSVYTDKENTTIKVKNFPADKVARLVSIYDSVPFGGYIETGTIEINSETVSGEVLLQKQNNIIKDRKLNVDGLIDFSLNKKEKKTIFSSQRLKTEFGEMAIKGSFNSISKDLRIITKAKISNMSFVNKYSTHFIDLNLSRWNLKQGAGYFSLNLTKKKGSVKFHTQLLVNDFFANGETIDSLRLDLQKSNQLTRGILNLNDKKLKSTGNIIISDKKTYIDFIKIDGAAKKLFKILTIPISVSGNFNGKCTFTQNRNSMNPTVNGVVYAKEFILADFKFNELKTNFTTNIDTLKLSNTNFIFNEGQGIADIYIDLIKKKYELTGNIKTLNINKIYGEMNGKGDLLFNGKGTFFNDPINISYNFPKTSYYDKRYFSFKGNAKIFTNFYDFDLEAEGKIINKKHISDYSFDLKKKGDFYNGNYLFNLNDINIVFPWVNNLGKISINGHFNTEKNGNLFNAGIANFKGKTLAIPYFSHSLDNYAGFITFGNKNFTLASLKGTIGGGNVALNGYINLKDTGIDKAQLNLTGNKMHIFPMSRTQFDMNADISLKYKNEQLTLDGNMTVLSGIWEREITEGISFYTSSNFSFEKSNPIIKNMNFNLRILGRKRIKMINSFGNITGNFDLTIKGTPETPIILGVIEGEKGEIYFSDSKFKLIKAKLLFNNKLEINPRIIMRSEAFIKNYRIKFDVNGTAERPLIEFRSSPSLPTQEIFALISLGELFEKQRSIEFSSQIGSTYLLSNALMDKIQKRAKKFGIDLLRIDTRLSEFATDNSPRLTVGTAVLKDILIVYSTNITGLRREVVYFQYQLSPTLSLIGMRNESGRFSLDIRYRKKD